MGIVTPSTICLLQGKMEMARDLAAEMAERGEGVVLDQFGNADNPLAHFRGTGVTFSSMQLVLLQGVS